MPATPWLAGMLFNLGHTGRIRPRHILLLVIFSLLACMGLLHQQTEGGVLSYTQNLEFGKVWFPDDQKEQAIPAFLEVPLTDEGCEGFDPSLPFEQDPPNCLRARQYRQVERVLAREKLKQHEHWWFTVKDNIVVFERLLTCFAEFPSPCPPKPLIVSGWWYTAMGIGTGTSGEAIWMKGILEYVEELGMSIVAVGPYENFVTVAEMLPDVYRTLWSSHVDTVTCLGDPRCVRDYVPPVDAEDLSIGVPKAERGTIPSWALSVVDYWGSRPLDIAPANAWYWGLTEVGDWSYHPLGYKWIVTPFPYPGHIHLPYSIESHCLPTPYTPSEERNNSVLLLAKRSSYFDGANAPERTLYKSLCDEVKVELLTSAKFEEGHDIPDGLITIPATSREGYAELLGSVKALLGIGLPVISPSVFTALCQGTPAVIPYFVENPRTDGWFLYGGGQYQHGPAQMIGPPYVYSYYVRNYTQMQEAIRTAIETPIERFILPEMRHGYGLERMREYLNRDVIGMYQQVLRENGGQIPRLQANVREQCYKIKACPAVFPPGRKPATPLD